jgi:hypothetical protein
MIKKIILKKQIKDIKPKGFRNIILPLYNIQTFVELF